MSRTKKRNRHVHRLRRQSVGPLRRALKATLCALFRIPHDCPISVGLSWRFFQLIGINFHVPWPVHFTSTVHSPERIVLGKGVYPGDSPGCYLQAINGIELGDYTNLGPGVGLISANHDPNDNDSWLSAPPIRLGKRCWVGMNAVILPGVQLGDGTIVGAGAIVTRSFPNGNCVIAGNPARVVKEVSHDE